MLVLTVGTDRLLSLFDLSKRDESYAANINRLLFMQDFVGQQIDLEHFSEPNWQPLKGTKQWNTASKWKRLCYLVGQSILNT